MKVEMKPINIVKTEILLFYYLCFSEFTIYHHLYPPQDLFL